MTNQERKDAKLMDAFLTLILRNRQPTAVLGRNFHVETMEEAKRLFFKMNEALPYFHIESYIAIP